MHYLDQILALPHAYLWLPAAAFLVVGGSIYYLVRPALQLASDASAKADAAGQAAADTPKAKDQRGAFRRHGNPVEVFIAKPEDKKEPFIGSVLDRSMGGVRLASFEEIQVGAIMSIRPVHAEEIVPWVEIEIRSCRPSVEMPDQFEIGCQYVKSPPYSIQLLFG